jgi:MFS family permease
VRLGVLGIRNFRLLFLGQVTSSFGDRLAPIALTFAVFDLTKSTSAAAYDLGFVFAAQTAPMFLLVAVAGVWGDRLPRQLVMLSSDVVRCASQGTTAALLLLHQAQVWELVALQAVYGAANAFFMPAQIGLIPAVVGSGQLREANALMSFSRTAAGVVGPAVGGTLVALISPGVAVAGDAATFLVSAGSLALLRVAWPAREATGASMLTEFREGLAEVRQRTWIWVLIVYFGLFNIFVWPPFFVLGAAVANHSLGGAGAWAALLVAGSAGIAVGSLVAVRFGASRPLFWGELACGLSALPALFLGLGLPLAPIVVVSFVRSIGLAWGDTLWFTALQEHVPERAISRVISLDQTGTLAFVPLGFALVGPFSAVVGVRATLVGSAILTAAATVCAVSVPSVRNLRAEPRPVPAMPEPTTGPSS